MSDLSYIDDAKDLWQSKEVVNEFKAKIKKLRSDHFSRPSGQERLGRELYKYCKALEIENTATINFTDRSRYGAIQFQKDIFAGIKPNYTSDQPPKGFHEGAAYLALLSDQFEHIAKDILGFAAKETEKTGSPDKVVEFRPYQIQSKQAPVIPIPQVRDKFVEENDDETTSDFNNEENGLIELKSKIPQYDLCFVLRWLTRELCDETLKSIGFNRLYSNSWSCLAIDKRAYKSYDELANREVTLHDRGRGKWHPFSQHGHHRKNSVFFKDDLSIAGEIRNYRFGIPIGCFFLDQNCILATLFSEYPTWGGGRKGNYISLHGGGETVSWRLKKKTIWVHTAGHRVRSYGALPIAFRGCDDDRSIVYIDGANLVLLDGIERYVSGKEKGLRFHIEQDCQKQQFYHACFSPGQSHVALSGYTDMDEDPYTGDRSYETCVRLFNLRTGDIDFSFPLSLEASVNGFSHSAFMNGQKKVIAYYDDGDIVFYDFGVSREVGRCRHKESSIFNQPSYTHPSIQFSSDNRFMLVRGVEKALLFCVIDLSKDERQLAEDVKRVVQSFRNGQQLDSLLGDVSAAVDRFNDVSDVSG